MTGGRSDVRVGKASLLDSRPAPRAFMFQMAGLGAAVISFDDRKESLAAELSDRQFGAFHIGQGERNPTMPLNSISIHFGHKDRDIQVSRRASRSLRLAVSSDAFQTCS
ncbi:MAG: hypothetical protein JSR99_15185 [Proteobacteria bacterium]|nr:hypothetical protein [Pseudomonadota bacterium]